MDHRFPGPKLQLFTGVILLSLASLFWLALTAAQTSVDGEKDLGEGLKFIMCLFCMIALALAGLVFVFKSILRFSRRA
jgi:hypothetical protein